MVFAKSANPNSVYFSLSLGINSIKLQGLNLESNWNFKISSQASVTAPDEPGNANT